MVSGMFLKKIGTSIGNVLVNIIMIVDAFVWFSYGSTIIKEIISKVASNYEILVFNIANFSTSMFSILIGAFLVDKYGKKLRFLLFWVLLGVFSSLSFILLEVTTVTSVLTISFLFSISFGLGLPACLAYFADHTIAENRAKIAGIIFFSMILGSFMLRLMTITNIINSSLILACLRGFTLIVFPFITSQEKKAEGKVSTPFFSILREHSFIFYLIPWTMFSLVNYLSIPIGVKIYGETFTSLSIIIGNVLAGVFAVIAGVLSDNIGRKRIVIIAFVMLGLAYSILGIYPLNIFSWYFYMMVDGAAWGIIYVIFLFTLWGDLAYGKPSEKYYALGILPYSLSGFLRVTVGSFIADVIPVYAIFSFAAFFLFLAVVPLMYAPETLPEKKIRERELKKYIEKAKKIKEKYVKE